MKVTYLNCDSKNDDKSDYRNYEHHLGSSEHKAWNYSSLYESRMLDLCDASAAMSGLEFCLLKLELKRKVDWIRTFFNKAIDGKDPISRALTSEQKLKELFPNTGECCVSHVFWPSPKKPLPNAVFTWS